MKALQKNRDDMEKQRPRADLIHVTIIKMGLKAGDSLARPLQYIRTLSPD